MLNVLSNCDAGVIMVTNVAVRVLSSRIGDSADNQYE